MFLDREASRVPGMSEAFLLPGLSHPPRLSTSTTTTTTTTVTTTVTTSG